MQRHEQMQQTEIQDNSVSESLENPSEVLNGLEDEYLTLIHVKNVDQWEALKEKFDNNRSLKTNLKLPAERRAEFARKSAYVAYHVIELKYEPYNSNLLTYPLSKKCRA